MSSPYAQQDTSTSVERHTRSTAVRPPAAIPVDPMALLKLVAGVLTPAAIFYAAGYVIVHM
jgi:hypothetical protein